MHEQRLSHRHRVISDDDLVFIRRLIAEHPGCSRRELSKKLCEAWNWVQPNGALRDMVCRSMMLKLHREGHIELPPVRFVPRNPLAQRRAAALVEVDQAPLRSSLADLGAIELRQVRRTSEEALFNSLMQQHHYLGYTQPVGEHLKYLVYAQRAADRLRGVELGAAPPGQPRPPHRLEHERAAGQHPAAGLQHALPDPAVGDGAASGLALAGAHGASAVGRLAAPVRAPDLLCWRPSSIRSAFAGTCYRAANWIHLGVTTGRGKDDLDAPGQSLDQAGAGLCAGEGLPPAAVAVRDAGMKQPEIVTATRGELDEILALTKPALPPRQYQLLEACCGTFEYVMLRLQNAKTSISVFSACCSARAPRAAQRARGRRRGPSAASAHEDARAELGDGECRVPMLRRRRRVPTARRRKQAGSRPQRRAGLSRRARRRVRASRSSSAASRCPQCGKGRVYDSPPKRIVKVVGQAPLAATVYRLQRLRCRLCDAVFTAALPEAVAEAPKYDASCASMHRVAALRQRHAVLTACEGLQATCTCRCPTPRSGTSCQQAVTGTALASTRS